MRKYTHTQCFEHFGVRPKNTQWSWSARGKGYVVHTCWQHRFEGGKYKQVFHNRDKHGYKELCKDLEYAQSECGGKFFVILAKAKDRFADPPKIEECWPSNMVLKITKFDPAQGILECERV
jgi:hypothetical protein